MKKGCSSLFLKVYTEHTFVVGRATLVVRLFLIMGTTQEPIEAIDAWQRWYQENRVVAQIDEPLVTKDSREGLHNTTNAVDTIAKERWMKKAQEHFADTIAEFQYELSGKDLYKAFYKAVYENSECARKEYEKIKELLDLLRYHNPD